MLWERAFFFLHKNIKEKCAGIRRMRRIRNYYIQIFLYTRKSAIIIF